MINTALHFSGGKDSLATLHLWTATNGLDDTVVVWVNTGSAYPSTIEFMKKVEYSVPHFLELKTNQPRQVERNGFPTDLVALHFTKQGHEVRETNVPYMVQDSFRCCEANIWRPLAEAMERHNIKRIVRGQRLAERYKSTIRSGHIENGVEYIFPIENWTDEEVFAYLRNKSVELPDYYATEKKSHDCWNCTGYLDEDAGRIANLPVDQRREVYRRLGIIYETIIEQFTPFNEVMKLRE